MLLKTKTKQIMKAIYKEFILNLYIMYDIQSKKEYVSFSIHGKKPNNYLDFSFRYEDMPFFVKHIYELVVKDYSLSKDVQNNSCVIHGPCLKTGEKFKITFIFENDYTDMLRRESVLIYDLDFSLTLANMYLKPIYDDIIDH